MEETNMRINTNVAAMNTHSRLNSANNSKAGSLEKLSSGLRINKAGDDAAGLAISEKMKNQISGMSQASRNAQDGISLIQTAEGALSETHSMLNRMRDLTVQAANDTNTNEDRSSIQKEINSLTEEIERVATNTDFNTKNLLKAADGETEKSFTFQIGANAGQSIDVKIKDMSVEGLFAGASVDAETSEVTNGVKVALAEGDPEDTKLDFGAELEKIDGAITKVSDQRAGLGAVQNRLNHTVSNLNTTKENLSEANSRIVDVDMAEEMMSFTKSNILSQAATSMLAQANQQPQAVLQLLG